MSALSKTLLHLWKSLLSMLLLTVSFTAFSQKDSLPHNFDPTRARIRVDSLPKVDSPVVAYKSKVDSVMLHHSPRKAAIRSALIPGWGQVYNKRIWKVPIIYGALGTTA